MSEARVIPPGMFQFIEKEAWLFHLAFWDSCTVYQLLLQIVRAARLSSTMSALNLKLRRSVNETFWMSFLAKQSLKSSWAEPGFECSKKSSLNCSYLNIAVAGS